MLYVIALDVLALIVVVVSVYIPSRDVDYASTALLPLLPVLLGMTMLATIVLGDSVPGSSSGRTIVEISYVVVLALWTTWLSWLFATHEKQPIESAEGPDTDGASVTTASKRKELTLLDVTVYGVLIAIVAVVSGVAIGPLYQRPVANASFIKGEASAIGAAAVKLSGNRVPTAHEITRALNGQKNSQRSYYDKIQRVGNSGPQTQYVVTNKLDSSKACLTITKQSFVVAGGTCA